MLWNLHFLNESMSQTKILILLKVLDLLPPHTEQCVVIKLKTFRNNIFHLKCKGLTVVEEESILNTKYVT